MVCQYMYVITMVCQYMSVDELMPHFSHISQRATADHPHAAEFLLSKGSNGSVEVCAEVTTQQFEGSIQVNYSTASSSAGGLCSYICL